MIRSDSSLSIMKFDEYTKVDWQSFKAMKREDNSALYKKAADFEPE